MVHSAGGSVSGRHSTSNSSTLKGDEYEESICSRICGTAATAMRANAQWVNGHCPAAHEVDYVMMSRVADPLRRTVQRARVVVVEPRTDSYKQQIPQRQCGLKDL